MANSQTYRDAEPQPSTSYYQESSSNLPESVSSHRLEVIWSNIVTDSIEKFGEISEFAIKPENFDSAGLRPRQRSQSVSSKCSMISSRPSVRRSSSIDRSTNRDSVLGDDPEPEPAAEDEDDREKPLIPVAEITLAQLGFGLNVHKVDISDLDLPPKRLIYPTLYEKIRFHEDTDFVILIGDKPFHCHHLALTCYTKFFDDKLGYREAALPEDIIDYELMELVYDWMVKDSTSCEELIEASNVMDILNAAKYLQINELEEQCWSFIYSELQSEHLALKMYLRAMSSKQNQIMEIALQSVCSIFLRLVATKDFLQLRLHELLPILVSNYVAVNCEEEILFSGVRWLLYDWQARKIHAREIMSCVRYGSIPSAKLVMIKEGVDFLEVSKVIKDPDVIELYQEGFRTSIVLNFCTDEKYLKVDGAVPPEPRNFLNDIPEHESYLNFLYYLESLIQ